MNTKEGLTKQALNDRGRENYAVNKLDVEFIHSRVQESFSEMNFAFDMISDKTKIDRVLTSFIHIIRERFSWLSTSDIKNIFIFGKWGEWDKIYRMNANSMVEWTKQYIQYSSEVAEKIYKEKDHPTSLDVLKLISKGLSTGKMPELKKKLQGVQKESIGGILRNEL